MSSEELDHSREVFEFEKAKWAESQQLEKRRTWLNGVSVGIPIIILAFTILFGLYQDKLGRDQEMRLKVAESVINSDSPLGSRNRIAVLSALFPEEVVDEYLQSADAAIAKTISSGPDSKRLLELLAGVKSTSERKDLLRMWLILYPRDRKRLMPLILSEAPDILATLESKASSAGDGLLVRIPNPEIISTALAMSPQALSIVLTDFTATTFKDRADCKQPNGTYLELVDLALFEEIEEKDLNAKYGDSKCGFIRTKSGEAAREELITWWKSLSEELRVVERHGS